MAGSTQPKQSKNAAQPLTDADSNKTPMPATSRQTYGKSTIFFSFYLINPINPAQAAAGSKTVKPSKTVAAPVSDGNRNTVDKG